MVKVMMIGFLNSKNTRRILIQIRSKLSRLVQDYADYKEGTVPQRFSENRLHHVFEFLKPFVWDLKIGFWNWEIGNSRMGVFFQNGDESYCSSR